ncbi:HEAT repeat protein [Dictyocaulus viviparus]|uniref:HEAT repeat protein n=1 Tax=Dictyocaulus viviparus TaxID=29172 RepID=A0A0D8X9Z2_DICVI|nr:HEAT repeat protein [Dictyocaulus viviparus]
MLSRRSSMPAQKRVSNTAENSGETDQENQGRLTSILSRRSNMPAQKRVSNTAKNSGAVNEDDFRKASTQVPKCDLKLLRSILLNGGMDYENELITAILTLEDAMRRQHLFLCGKLETSIVRLCEALLPAAISVIQNSMKIMSSSGTTACYFIVKHVEHPKLITIVLSFSSSKSKEIRRVTQDLVGQIIAIWTPCKQEKSLNGIVDCIKAGISDADPQARASARNSYQQVTQDLVGQIIAIWTPCKQEKSLNGIVDCIKAGISDADPQARASARNNYQQLDQHFPHHAQLLFQASLSASLDPSKQRSLSGAVSAASSSQSISSELDSLNMAQRLGALEVNRAKTTNFFAGRSASEIDANGVRRAAAFTPSKSKLSGSIASRNTSGSSKSRSVFIYCMFSSRNPLKGKLSPFCVFDENNSMFKWSKGMKTLFLFSGSNHNTSSHVFSWCMVNLITFVYRNEDDYINQNPWCKLKWTFKFHGQSTTMQCYFKYFLLSKNFSLNGSDNEDCLFGVIRLRRSIPQPEIKKICKVLNKLLTKKIIKSFMQIVMNILNVFVSSYHDSLGEWLQFLLLKLLHRSGLEISPTVVQSLNMTLRAVRTTFRPELQLIAVCRIIMDPIPTPPVKVKAATLNYLHELLQEMEQGTNLTRDEVRAAVQQIPHWMEDPKNTTMKVVSFIYKSFSVLLLHLNISFKLHFCFINFHRLITQSCLWY